MHDRTARQIRDLLLCMLWIQLAILAVGILLLSIAGYWHLKADAARQRLLDPPPQVSQARSDRPMEFSFCCRPRQLQSPLKPRFLFTRTYRAGVMNTRCSRAAT